MKMVRHTTNIADKPFEPLRRIAGIFVLSPAPTNFPPTFIKKQSRSRFQALIDLRALRARRDAALHHKKPSFEIKQARANKNEQRHAGDSLGQTIFRF